MPWWQEAIKRGLVGSKRNCETCMNGPESLSEDSRQLAGCGYLPPLEEKLRPYLSVWNGLGYSGDKPTVCPGYSTNLPETIEIARGRFWKRDLRSFTGGAAPTEALLLGIEILESSSNECQSWCMDNREKGGK